MYVGPGNYSEVYPALSDPIVEKQDLFITKDGTYNIAGLWFGEETQYVPFGYSGSTL